MYILYTDETNLSQSTDRRFFIYGGLFLPLDHLPSLQQRIEEIRTEGGYQAEDLLKFDTNSRPSHVDVGTATEVKRQVIETCQEHDCQFIVYAILHDILKNSDLDEQVLWAVDAVIDAFNRVLHGKSEAGICLFDNFPGGVSQKDYLIKKHTRGLGRPGGGSSLEHIQLYGVSHLGASHLASAVDIVLGAFRYCINNPKNRDAASRMMASVFSMVSDQRVILRPVEGRIISSDYKAEYEALRAHILSLLAEYGET